MKEGEAMSVRRVGQFANLGLALIGILLGTFPGAGQETSGSVRGEVTDPSGASVPKAQIELRNVDTGVISKQESGAQGQFVFNLVPPGNYVVRVTAAGFRTVTVSGVLVEINKNTVANIRLEVGVVTETVQVSAAAPGIETSSAQVGTNVERRYVSEMPIQSRNVLKLAELAPGATIVRDTSQANGIEGTYARVNGLRMGSNVFYLEGSDNTGSFRNSALQFPNPDAVQEVQVSTANASAEFGKQPGGVFNIVTKSGTNEFHGSGFYFFRNKNLNANSWSRNISGAAKPDDFVKQYGGTLGGPIQRNKTFFFASFMRYTDETPGFQNTVKFPTKAMLDGNFSQFDKQLYDPDTGQPLAGNQIPTRLIDPVTKKLAAELIPTVANFGDRYVWAYTDPYRNHELLAKIDHTFNSAHSLQFSYFRVWGKQTQPENGKAANMPGWGPQENLNKQHTSTFRHTWVLTPNLVLQNRFALAFFDIERQPMPLGRNLSDFGSNWPLVDPSARKYLPGLRVSDGFYAEQGDGTFLNQHNWRLSPTLNWVRGKHNLKFGFEYQNDFISDTNDQDGAFLSFDGHASSQPATGNPVGLGMFGYATADFVMGRAAEISVLGVLSDRLTTRAYYGFVQDQWRVTSRLTLTPGLRYELYSPPSERDNKLSAFRLGWRSTRYSNAPPHLAFVGEPGFESVYRWDKNNFGPRLGLAYDLRGNGKTAIRASAGYYYGFLAAQAKMLLNEQPPWQPTASGGMTLNMTDPWVTSRTVLYTKPPMPFSKDPSTFNYPSRFSVRGFDPHWATPYTLQWNFSVEHEVWKGITVQAAYVGNRGFKLFQQVNYNVPVWRDDANSANVNARRPLANYTAANYMSTRSKSWYDSFQLTLNTREWNGFTSRFTYVFGKALAYNDEDIGLPGGGGTYPLALNLDKAQNNPHHVGRFFFVYDLPVLRQNQAWTGKLLGNWQISGSVFATSGSPLNVTLGQDWNFDGSSSDRPNLVSKITYATGSKDVRASGYFSRDSFAAPPIRNAYGTLGRNAIWGPGQWNVDLGVVKGFALTERMRCQFRAESFNLFNHNNLGNPSTNMRSLDFTKIVSRFGNRTMQMAVRFEF